MQRGAQSPELKQAFETHKAETEGHVERLQQVFEIIGKRAQGKTCPAIDGIIEEGEESSRIQGDAGPGCRPDRRRPGGGALRDHPIWDPKALG